MTTDYLLAIGANTGNSLDAVDVVLTKFGSDGSIIDLDALSVPMPKDITDCLRAFRTAAMDSLGDMDAAGKSYQEHAATLNLSSSTMDKLITNYTLHVSNAVKKLIDYIVKKGEIKDPIDLIGFHGQTCAHQPPSIAKSAEETYTIQIGDGQLLANETGITVVYDFRSDDLMNGGEGAPLAPVHHEHLACHLKDKGKFPIAFCNAGNTGNISIITEHKSKGIISFGWDVGPFNNYPDKLVQNERSAECDFDGKFGSPGKVNVDLLKILFDKGAVTDKGANFLLQPPPKSSDPQWYRLLPELLGQANVGLQPLSFEDRLRTAEYFSVYIYFYTLKWLDAEVLMPTCYALCGGGWNNPISRNHFELLLQGQFDKHPILSEHKDTFNQILNRLRKSGKSVEIAMSDEFGFSGQYMEARLFADTAVCRITGEPFSRPETTGCSKPSVLGIIRFPNKKPELASEKLKQWLVKYKSANLTLDKPDVFNGRWSRAASGWQERIKVGSAT